MERLKQKIPQEFFGVYSQNQTFKQAGFEELRPHKEIQTSDYGTKERPLKMKYSHIAYIILNIWFAAAMVLTEGAGVILFCLVIFLALVVYFSIKEDRHKASKTPQ